MAQAKQQYDLIVIGGGAAGLTAAQTAVRLGVRVAMIEKEHTGGDCTWVGCVPSKALLAAAKLAHAAREGHKMGVRVSDVEIDFAGVMQHVHSTIHQIYEEETPDVLRGVGIDVYINTAHFIDPHTIALDDGTQLTSKHFVIATGGRAIVPAPFSEVPYLTNRTLFDLKTQPKHLIILGGGPIGTEMAQAFIRLGTRVTVIDQQPRLLPRDDHEASDFMMQRLRDEGVELRLGVSAKGARTAGENIIVELEDGSSVEGDQLLLALGRRPYIEGLNVQAAGCEVDDQGKLVLDANLQTTQKHIYAAGDVTGGPQFTHLAGSHGFTVIRNLFLPLSSKATMENVPWTTFTDPEVAHAGMTEREAREKHGSDVQIIHLPMTRSDRAMTEGKAEGFLKAVHLSSGKLLGMTIVGINAGDLINEWAAIIARGGSVRDASGKMRVYPAFESVNGIVATTFLKKWLADGFAGKVLRGVVKITG